MPTAICENDAPEKDRIMIANQSQRTVPLFLFIARPLDFVVYGCSSTPRHCAAKIGPWLDYVPTLSTQNCKVCCCRMKLSGMSQLEAGESGRPPKWHVGFREQFWLEV
jgi:hypothetical protein